MSKYWSEEAERTVLGLILSSPESAAEVMSALEPEHFYDETHREMFQLMSEMFGEQRPLDSQTFFEYANAKSKSDLGIEASGLPVVDTRNAQYWCERVVDQWQRRQVLEAGYQLVSEMENVEGELDNLAFEALLERYQSRISKMVAVSAKRPDDRELIRQRMLEDLDEAALGAGLHPGWRKLKDQIGNIMPGKLITVVSYSNQGKSTLLANMFVRLLMQGAQVAAFPTEMGHQWLHRAVAIWAHVKGYGTVHYRSIENGIKLTPEENRIYRAAHEDLFNTAGWIVNTRAHMTPRMLLATMKLYRRQGYGIFIVDHGHRLRYRSGDKFDHMADTVVDVRNFAKDEEACVIMAYQPRKPDNEDALIRPITETEIRGPSEIWNEVDISLLPYRPVVEADENDNTVYSMSDVPKILKSRPEDARWKLDNENFHLKVGKRRAGGEGDCIFLPFHKDTGTILGPLDLFDEDMRRTAEMQGDIERNIAEMGVPF